MRVQPATDSQEHYAFRAFEEVPDLFGLQPTFADRAFPEMQAWYVNRLFSNGHRRGNLA
jgi:hypothetical protein